MEVCAKNKEPFPLVKTKQLLVDTGSVMGIKPWMSARRYHSLICKRISVQLVSQDLARNYIWTKITGITPKQRLFGHNY